MRPTCLPQVGRKPFGNAQKAFLVMARRVAVHGRQEPAAAASDISLAA